MKKFGFGLMRLPLKDDDDLASIDYNKVNEMVDEYIKRGYNFLIQVILIIMVYLKLLLENVF